MKLKKATPSDISLIQQLATESWKSHYPSIISGEQIEYMLDKMYSETALQEHFDNPNYHYYLLGQEEEFYGFMGFENHYELGTTKLHRIYLIEKGKGIGLGKAAIHLLKDQIKTVGDHRIILNVNKENPSFHFYLSQNFSVYDEIVLEIGNGYVMDDFLMEYTTTD